MGKALVLAEKPSVGRDLARVLGCGRPGNGYFEGDRYIVTWALGHLVTLADPESYDERYKTWRMEDLPMLPEPLKLVVIKQTGRQYNSVKEQLSRKDVTEVIIATDAGREGELVARWILAKAHVHKPVKRLWTSSVTDKAIQEGFRNLRPGREYENLYASAVARSEADWLVGINASRALTCRYNAQLSCGRVQTPTLAIIAQREREIQSFKPRSFYGISAAVQGARFFWQDGRTKETRTFAKEVCDKLLRELQGKNLEITGVEKTYKKKPSPSLYDLTELQRDANKLYAFSAKETLNIMQRLYETHKILTYPRTDSRYISEDIVATLPDRIRACTVGPYARLGGKALRSNVKGNKHVVDDGKVSDHHAIIPTEQPVFLNNLDDKERKIYDLVVKRFLAALYPAFEYEQTTLTAKIGGENFVARGKRIISQGWKEVYENRYEDEEAADELAEQNLPPLNKGELLKVAGLLQTKGETKAPPLFNEATLLTAMENPARYMENADETLKKTLGETGGLGTVATRADIIEKLFNSFLIEKKGKELHITSKGRQLLELVPHDLKSPELTANWEQKLAAIAKGRLDKNSFIAEMRGYAKAVVADISNSKEQYRHDNMTRTKCPDCGKYMLEVSGKKGKMLVCQDRECGHRKGIARVTNARCPNCHKKLEMRGEGESRLFVCGCGYREKLSAFNARREKETSKLSKRDVSQYLREQNKAKDEPLNSALAEALAKLNLK